MEAKEVRLTSEGVAKYEARLEYLKTECRANIAEQIKAARAFGDISENAEYDEAKNEQARIEHEIMQLETMLANAVIINEDAVDITSVNIGAKVRLKNITDGTEGDYFIVGSAEANPLEFKISNESPVGEAVMGHGKGDIVDVPTPAGALKYKIIDIYK